MSILENRPTASPNRPKRVKTGLGDPTPTNFASRSPIFHFLILCGGVITHHVSRFILPSDHYIKKPLINQQYRYSSPLPFPFSRFPTSSPPHLLVFSFSRFGYFFVSFFYIPTFCCLAHIIFRCEGENTDSAVRIYWFAICALLSLPTKCRIISHHF